MVVVYLVIDHWSNFEDMMYSHGLRRFFVTKLPALYEAVKRGCDVIVDNGSYWRGYPDFGLALLAARMGLKYIMPDVIGDPVETVELHLKFADMVSEKELSNGFVVLQGRTVEENVQQLEKLRELGIVKKYVAFGGVKELRRKKSLDRTLVSGIYRHVKRYGYWLHVLGRTCKTCDSFDTASWGYRMLDKHLESKEYSVEDIVRMVRKYEAASINILNYVEENNYFRGRS